MSAVDPGSVPKASAEASARASGAIEAPQPKAASDGEALEQFLSDADLHVDGSTNEPKWDGAPMDLADTLTWMLMADSDP